MRDTLLVALSLISLCGGAALAMAAPEGAQEPASEPSPALQRTDVAAGLAAAQDEEQETEAAPESPASADELMLPTVRETLTDEEEQALRLVQEILAEQDMLLSGSEFVYQAEGRRDPFRSLLQVRQRQLAAPEQRPAGLPGFLVNEVELKAVARFKGRWTAMLMGLDRRTYFANVGTELYDGRIVEIGRDRVVFEQEVEDMLGARSTRRVVKRLSQESEG